MFQQKIIIITAPSGSGKTTLVRRLLSACPRLAFSVSACTRKPRPGEADGQDYYFISEERFRNLIAQDAFVEWEMVYTGKFYGTLKSEFSRIAAKGKFPLVDIDVEGALAIRAAYPLESLAIFIQAPSLAILRERLEARNTESKESLDERLEKAAHETTFADQFDHIVINEDLDIATQDLVAIVNDFIDG